MDNRFSVFDRWGFVKGQKNVGKIILLSSYKLGLRTLIQQATVIKVQQDVIISVDS